MHGMGQSNQALLRLMDAVVKRTDAAGRRAIPNTLQSTTTVRRSFQILTKHREEAIAVRQAEAAFADMRQRYPGQVHVFSHRVLREWFAAEGLIGYVINGEIETTETTVALPDGMCLSYQSPSIPDQRP